MHFCTSKGDHCCLLNNNNHIIRDWSVFQTLSYQRKLRGWWICSSRGDYGSYIGIMTLGDSCENPYWRSLRDKTSINLLTIYNYFMSQGVIALRFYFYLYLVFILECGLWSMIKYIKGKNIFHICEIHTILPTNSTELYRDFY